MLVFLIILILLLAGFVALCNFYVSYSAKGKIFHNLDELPFYPVGLVLGTSSKRDNGEPNQYFVNRLAVANISFVKRDFRSGYFLNSLDRFGTGVGKIVGNDNAVSCLDKLNAGVRAYVACASGKQYFHFFHPFIYILK